MPFAKVTNPNLRAARGVPRQQPPSRSTATQAWRGADPVHSFTDWQALAAAQYTIRASQQIPSSTPEMVKAGKLYRLFTRGASAGERAAAGLQLNRLIARFNFTIESVAVFAATEAQ